MSNYTQPRITSQSLPRAQANIYQSLLYNFNKPQQKRELLTRSLLAEATEYALNTVRDALQALSKKGLVYYNTVLKCWVPRVLKQKIEDVYDAYINLKRDWKSFVSKMGGKIMTKMRWDNPHIETFDYPQELVELDESFNMRKGKEGSSLMKRLPDSYIRAAKIKIVNKRKLK